MAEDQNRDDERDEKGRFRPGNRGGPGRPPRAIERQYLEVLGDTISLDDWRAVCDKALEDAKSGDWLAQHVVGNEPISLSRLAALELAEVSVDEEIDDERSRIEIYRAMNPRI